MMSALPQSATAPSLATFLTAIGQAPAASGDENGFGQLFASAPMPGGAPVAAKAELPLTIEAMPTSPATIGAEAPAKAPAAKGAANPADIDAAIAASLLIAVAGPAAAATPAGPKTALPETETAAETGATAQPAPAGEPATPPAIANISWPPAAAATPATEKPAKPAHKITAQTDATQPSAPAAAKPVASPMPGIVTPAEPPAAKPVPADGGASMTILFTQPGTQGAAAIAEAAQPAIVTERVLDLGSDDAWIEQLAHDIAATKSQTGDISFRLMPRHLGRLDVAMQMGDEGVSLKLDTRHEATATIVTAAQGRLIDDLRQQGVRVAGAEVTCTPGETGRQSQQGQGRSAAQDSAHLIETANDRAEARPKTDSEERAADRRGRFA